VFLRFPISFLLKTMKIIFLSNNPISASLSDWLSERAEVVMFKEKLSSKHISAIQPDLIVSYSYQHIIRADVLAALPNKFINLHISLLPYNRGADPNVWSFLGNTPKGVSVHLIDPGIDTGDILMQREVFFEESNETLESSYRSLHGHIQGMFQEKWDELCQGAIAGKPQVGEGTFHKAVQFEGIKNKLLGKEGWRIPIPVFRKRYRLLNPT
jgi:methionyl-tRNA formyltransferase